MRRALLITGLLLLAILARAPHAAAEPPSAADSPPILSPNDVGTEEEVVVRIRGRKFIPPTVRLHAERKTRLVFKNEDAELHAFVPGNLFNGVNLNVGGNGAPEFGDQGFRKVIIPGEGLAELRFVLRESGRYPFICDMPGHEMRGTIVVE
jgi:plastocyanin